MEKEPLSPMNNILQLLSLGLFAVTLSSCDVGAGAYAGARPGYSHPRPYYNNGDFSNGYYGHHHPSYYQSRSAPQYQGVNAGVNARVAPLNVNTGLRLF
jgi:hypothetical protein